MARTATNRGPLRTLLTEAIPLKLDEEMVLNQWMFGLFA
jgi:hypothetical protein